MPHICKKKKLVLHVGLPKTGSTALQYWFAIHHKELRKYDINYPVILANDHPPKHQFLINGLIYNQLDELRDELSNNNAKTLVLSTEGLTNHLYDFSRDALKAFREATQSYDVSIFLIFREMNAWMKAYYKQAVINPPLTEYYATPLPYAEYIQLPRMLRLTNISALQSDVARAYGASEVFVAKYEEEWMKYLVDFLGVIDLYNSAKLERKNCSVSDDLAEIIRQVNKMNLEPEVRASALASIANNIRTKHGSLNSYRISNLHDPAIFKRLQPKNSAQMSIIAKILV